MAQRRNTINKKEVERLVRLYQETYKVLAAEVLTATEAGRINVVRVMARINKELEALGVDVDEWVKKNIPEHYLAGGNQALQDLRRQEVELGRAPAVAAINREAIQALVATSTLEFQETIRGMSRSARLLLNDAKRQQINYIVAQGKLQGDARRTISAAIEKRLDTDGIPALIDRNGRRWQPDTYAEMLARTKLVESRNQGLANRMLTYGYDLVEVSFTGTKHKECAVWENKVLSLTGGTTGELEGNIEVAGTVEEALDAGLFHPNCEHQINVINPRLAAKTKAYDPRTKTYKRRS